MWLSVTNKSNKKALTCSKKNATMAKSRFVKRKSGSLAQSVEQLPLKQTVVGSNPT